MALKPEAPRAPTPTPLPAHAPQCAANCNTCNNAGEGKCNLDGCAGGFGVTSTSTCAPVRLRAAHVTLNACTHVLCGVELKPCAGLN